MKTHWHQVISAPRRAALLLAGISLLLAFALSGCFWQPAEQSDDSILTEGRQLFVANCTVCHGEQGDKIAEAPLHQKQFLDSLGNAPLVHVIAEGKGVMPAWGKSKNGPLTYPEIYAVVAYLNSVAGRTSPSLVANSGRNVYQQNCARCHGDNGDRIPVAPLAAKPFVDSFSNEQLFELIADGKGLMPAFRTGSAAPLAPEQVRAVVSYLRYNANANVLEESRRGRELYVSNCLPCHGERGDRVPNVALASPGLLQKLGDGGLTSTIAFGKGVMPAFATSKGGTFEVAELAALLTYLKSWAGLPAGSAVTAVERSSLGRELYMKNCTGCHGENGDKVAGVNLTSHAYLDGRTDDAVARQISQGSAHGMPAWGQTTGGPLSDQEIMNLLGYLRSIAGNAPLMMSALPTLSLTGAQDAAAHGKELYRRDCAACHGEGRAKVPTANLADAAWLQQRSDDALAQSISFGKGSMPSWGKERRGPFTNDDIAAILTYLKSAAGSAGAPVTAIGGAPASAPAPTVVKAFSGDAAQGQKIFARNCTACHGEGGNRLPSADLADGAWLRQKGDATLLDSIANGRGAMPSWSTRKGGILSDQDIAALLAYLKAAAGIDHAPAAGSTPAPASATGGAAPAAAAQTAEPTPTAGPSAPIPPKPALTPVPAPATVPTPVPVAPAPPAAPAPTAAAAPPASATAADATRGKELYTKNCAACHGAKLDTMPRAKLGDATWLEQKGDAALTDAIATGAGKMRAWAKENGGPLTMDDIADIIAYLKAFAASGG